MELVGDILIAAPRPKVWAGLNDPEVLVRCIPGCEAKEATSPTERTARVAVKVGPVRARFAGHVRMEDVRTDEGCVLRFEGSGGAAGMAKGHARVDLADEAGGTRLRYTTQASVGGKLGQVGGRMIDAAAKQMADQFFDRFAAQLTPPPGVGAGSTTGADGMVQPVRNTDTEYLADRNAPGPVTQHGATGMSPGGPVDRPNPRGTPMGLPLRILTGEFMGFPFQVWGGLAAFLVVILLIFFSG